MLKISRILFQLIASPFGGGGFTNIKKNTSQDSRSSVRIPDLAILSSRLTKPNKMESVGYVAQRGILKIVVSKELKRNCTWDNVIFEILMAVNVSIVVFCVVTLCSLGGYQLLGGTYCIYLDLNPEDRSSVFF